MSDERRHRRAQRQAVDETLPDDREASVLRLADGPVLVYDEYADKRNPVELRAVVMPDGEVLGIEHDRFRRLA